MKLKVMAAMLVASTALAFTGVEEVNKAVAEVLKVVNNNLVYTRLAFTDLEIDETRTLKFGAEAIYQRKGQLTDLVVRLPELSYDASGSASPKLKAKLSGEADLLAIMEREDINELGPMVSEVMKSMAEDAVADLGEAVYVEVETLDYQYDDEGNFVSVSVSMDMSIDHSLLPSDIPSSEMPLKDVSMVLSADLTSIGVDLSVNLNKDYKGFEDDELGLKEMIELLLVQDPETLRGIQDMMLGLDQMADHIANKGLKDGSEL